MAGDELQSADDEMICAVLVRAENRMQTALQKKKSVAETKDGRTDQKVQEEERSWETWTGKFEEKRASELRDVMQYCLWMCM